jgi:recombinational DNA repair protein (RecF pathway)
MSAGETAKSTAICIAVHPWSRTSHVVRWLTPNGPVTTVVKGAMRPKSAFLGQYDLNYTCEIVYYLRAQGEVHALRECVPLNLREDLRGDFRLLALADYFRRQIIDNAPCGPEAAEWYDLAERSLTGLISSPAPNLAKLVAFELEVLHLAGLSPEMEADEGVFSLRGERKISVSAEVAKAIRDPLSEKNPQILVDAARVIGVFYTFHLDCAPQARRIVLQLISKKNNRRRDK